MTQTNNEIGRAWTLYVLGQLSDTWPRRVDFNAEDLVERTELGSDLEEDEANEMFDDLFRWLQSERFIAFNQAGEGWVVDVALTTKAMDAIGHAIPTDNGAAGTRLKKIVGGAGSTAGQAIISETIGQIIGAAARSFNGV